MKIKTIKIKVENENQEFDFSEFFTGSNTIFTTSATLVKEKQGYFWHAFITYEPKTSYSPTYLEPERALPEGFEDEIKTYTKLNPPKYTRSKNAILAHIDRVLDIKEIKGFHKIKNVGKKIIESDTDYFNAIMGIAKKYQV